MPLVDIARLERVVQETNPLLRVGHITQVVGLVMEAAGPMARVGELCRVQPAARQETLAEVVGFRGNHMLLLPLHDHGGVEPGTRVVASGEVLQVPVGDELLGRILDGLGRPIDGRGPLGTRRHYPVLNSAPGPMQRPRISQPLSVGIRAIDGLVTCARGQRMGIFSGSGVGKSTLLGMIARNTEADVTVIALVGERGREVRDFVDKDLGEEGLRRSVVVAATSDCPPLMRIKAAFAATAIAEYFRDQGRDVLLMMDSLTRFAMAQREVGLAAGEPPATRGYPPSVFALLPKLLERAGTAPRGTITGFYTVLVDGDDPTEPIADAVRGILDGHVWLSRELANRGQYPAVDVLQSVSRLMIDVVDEEHYRAAEAFRSLLATYREAEDLVNIGAYAPGSNPRIDLALRLIESMWEYLRQPMGESSQYGEARERLIQLAQAAQEGAAG